MTNQFNTKHSAYIIAAAGKKDITMADTTPLSVETAFNKLYAYFLNIQAIGTKIAKVSSDIYNAIIDSQLSVTLKRSGVNIDNETITKFKDFVIEPIPDNMLGGMGIIAYIGGIGKAFTGIVTTRTIESEDFDGVALQGAGKAGEFVINDNKKAIATVAAPPATIVP
jgi:hypothetical protein